MKTTVKQIAAGTLVILLSFAINVHAHGSKASGRENNYEPALRIEDWMISKSDWNVSPSEELLTGNEAEAELKVEKWMTDTYAWDASMNLDNETEEELQLEKWMTDSNLPNTISVTEETEPALEVAGWMINN